MTNWTFAGMVSGRFPDYKRNAMKAKLLAGLVFAGALFMGAPAYATEGKVCEGYAYLDSGKNLCDRFGTRTGDVDCPEVGEEVLILDPEDKWRLDNDGDGHGCEEPTPSPSTTSPSATVKPTTPPSSSPTKVPPTSPKPSKSGVANTIDDQPQLPKTGPTTWVLAGAGVAVVAIGSLVVWSVRRRKVQFRA